MRSLPLKPQLSVSVSGYLRHFMAFIKGGMSYSLLRLFNNLVVFFKCFISFLFLINKQLLITTSRFSFPSRRPYQKIKRQLSMFQRHLTTSFCKITVRKKEQILPRNFWSSRKDNRSIRLRNSEFFDYFVANDFRRLCSSGSHFITKILGILLKKRSPEISV